MMMTELFHGRMKLDLGCSGSKWVKASAHKDGEREKEIELVFQIAVNFWSI